MHGYVEIAGFVLCHHTHRVSLLDGKLGSHPHKRIVVSFGIDIMVFHRLCHTSSVSIDCLMETPNREARWFGGTDTAGSVLTFATYLSSLPLHMLLEGVHRYLPLGYSQPPQSFRILGSSPNADWDFAILIRFSLRVR